MADPRRGRGFTLLEVLVALVIVALGLLAAFGQVNQTVTTAGRLRDKTLAHWVASNEMTRVRLLLLQEQQFPPIGSRSDEIEMAKTDWRFTIKVSKTAVDAMRRVDISVAFADRPDTVVTTLTGFVARPGPPPTGQDADMADWFPLEPTEP
jgi:general secretion pathway protein I